MKLDLNFDAEMPFCHLTVSNSRHDKLAGRIAVFRFLNPFEYTRKDQNVTKFVAI